MSLLGVPVILPESFHLSFFRVGIPGGNRLLKDTSLLGESILVRNTFLTFALHIFLLKGKIYEEDS